MPNIFVRPKLSRRPMTLETTPVERDQVLVDQDPVGTNAAYARWLGGAGFLRLSRRVDGAQLLHHAHHVPVGPAFYDLAL